MPGNFLSPTLNAAHSLSLSLSLKKYSLSHARCHIVLKHSDPRKPEGKKLSESQLVPKESHYETGGLN